jgi:CDP-glycerol glycerophosphotransferase
VPRISVIVPIYDVELYLPACLESVAAQTWEDIEVVMVDDGSPDSSAEIARGFAERDGRFRLVRQANLGLSAARDTGVRHATGDFLAFLDSDDLLPPYALEYMLASLQESGSDLATGNVGRYDGRRARQSAMHRIVFSGPAATTHVTRTGVLMRDRQVTNKLWRRSFWDAHGFGFPHGVLYEDMLVALRGHVLAGSVDVLPAQVYLWRERAAGSRSITQEKTRERHLADRFSAVWSVRKFLAAEGLTAHIPAWDHAVLDSDLTNFLDVLDQAPEAYHERFLDLACDYLDRVSPAVLDGLPAIRRLEWHLVRHRRLADLLEVVTWDRQAASGDRLVRRLGRSYLATPLLERLPAALSRVGDSLHHRIDEITWRDGRLVVEGRTTPRHLRPTRRFHQQVFASLVQEGTGRRVRVGAAVRRAKVSRGGHDGREDWGGFRLTIDPRRLGAADDEGLWLVEMRVVHRGTIVRGPLADPGAGRPAQVGARALGRDRYVVPLLTEAGVLALRVETERARVVGQNLWGGRLRLEGRVVAGRATGPARGGAQAGAGRRGARGRAARAGKRRANSGVSGFAGLGPEPVLRVTRRPGGVPLLYPIRTDGRAFTADVDLRDVLPAHRTVVAEKGMPNPPAEWRVEVRSADGVVTPVTFAEDLPEGRHGLAGREVVVFRDHCGGLVLRDQPAAAFVDLAEWLPGGELLIEGGFAEPYELDALVVRSRDGRVERTVPIEGTGARFRARLTPEAVDSPLGRLPLPRGRYGLAVMVGGSERELPVEFAPDFGLVHETARRTFTLDGDGTGHAVLLVSGDLSGDERGARAQRTLRKEAYPAQRDRPLWPAVFFDCDDGTAFSDSPRAIYQELARRGTELTVLWNVHDGQVALPGDVEPVRTHGREYYEALARCRYVVTNDHLPPWFERRPGQTVVQTWHGSPLDKVGHDEAARHGRLSRQVGQWTHLLSAGPWWTPLLREAFEFHGEIVEEGLPRNDVLRAPGHETVAARVRRRLGVPDGWRLVLYAPEREETLDLDRVVAALRDDRVLLARRGDAGRSTPAGVLDVSGFPDGHELYLAADALVTDCSRVMFDFAVTGRPILFHVDVPPAGLYLDFRAEAPGPSLRTTDEVAEAIRNLGEVAEKYAGLSDAFVARYCPLDDGRAAARVADRLFA